MHWLNCEQAGANSASQTPDSHRRTGLANEPAGRAAVMDASCSSRSEHSTGSVRHSIPLFPVRIIRQPFDYWRRCVSSCLQQITSCHTETLQPSSMRRHACCQPASQPPFVHVSMCQSCEANERHPTAPSVDRSPLRSINIATGACCHASAGAAVSRRAARSTRRRSIIQLTAHSSADPAGHDEIEITRS